MGLDYWAALIIPSPQAYIPKLRAYCPLPASRDVATVQQPPCSDALALRLPPSALARQRRLPSRRSPIVAARRLLPSCAAEAALHS